MQNQNKSTLVGILFLHWNYYSLLQAEQLVVTFIAGYIAGVFCAIVSHPADTIVSKLNKDETATFMGVAKNLGFWGMIFMRLSSKQFYT